jgi:hypothetical protein
MGSMEADGIKLKGISCKVDGGLGLLGGLVLAAGFVKRKPKLDACAGGKVAETTVSWTAAGGKMTQVKADAPDPKVARCVEKALAGAEAPMPAACVATLVHGK